MSEAILLDETSDFPTLSVLIIKQHAQSVEIENLKTRLRGAACQVLVKTTEIIERDGTIRTLFLIGCEVERLLKEAEVHGIYKVGPHGDMVPFSFHSYEPGETDQVPRPSVDAINLFSQSEKLRLLSHILNRLRVSTKSHVQGEITPLIYASVPHLRQQGIVADAFPLHDREKLNQLSSTWYATWNFQTPLNGIRDYFGEKIAIYFAFLSFYTKALLVCAAIAIVHRVAFYESGHAQAVFAVVNLILLTVLLKLWQRRCSTLAYYWGTLGYVKLEESRPEFHGEKTVYIAGRQELVYPSWKRWRTILLLSYPIVAIWLGVAVFIIWLYFWVQYRVDAYYLKMTNVFLGYLIWNIPTIVYTIVIEILNRFYKRIAVVLTKIENHRLQSEYERHLLTKLILFQFVNCFGWLFYVAFLEQDMEVLRRYLACLMITYQIINQVTEWVIPYISIRIRKRYAKKVALPEQKRPIAAEEQLPEYEDTFYDYLELWLQFGYAFMFSCVYPMAAFWAFANNILEMRADAFKLCKNYRRPFPQVADSIGPWQTAFDCLVIVAVLTNSALLGMSPSVDKHLANYSKVQRVLLIVLLEHIILLIIVSVNKLVNNIPFSIRSRLTRVAYTASTALAHQRMNDWKKRQDEFAQHRSNTVDGYSDNAKQAVTFRRGSATFRQS